MDTSLNDDHELLRKTARDLLARRAPVEALAERESRPAEPDGELWREMADLGWTGLLVPERHGGAAASHLDVELLAEEMGRVLLPPPFVAAVAAGQALAAAPHPHADALLAGLAAGTAIPVLAVTEPHGRWTGACETVFEDGRVTGHKRFVDGACAATHLLTTAKGGDGELRLVAVDVAAPGVSVEPTPAIAGGVWGAVDLDGAEGIDVGAAADVLDAAVMTAAVATAGWCAGAAARLLQDTVVYVSNRRQFGVPVGSFQAVQHSLADCDVAAAESETLARWAAVAVDRSDAAGRRLASTAFVRATRGLVEVTRRCHQAWGGMGFSTEAHVHHFSRRAKLAQHSWGGPEHHLAVIAAELRHAPLLRDRYLPDLPETR